MHDRDACRASGSIDDTLDCSIIVPSAGEAGYW